MKNIEEQIDDVVNDSLLFAPEPNDEDFYSYELNDGLDDWEIEEARLIAPYTRGLMLVTGDIGSGKDLFSNVFAWKIKSYFRGKRVLRDEMPRRAFGYYIPFDEVTISRELDSMEELSDLRGGHQVGKKVKEAALKSAVDRWVKSKSVELLMQNSVLFLTEFWKYMHKRRQMTNICYTLAGLIKLWRHHDQLIMGITQDKYDLDPTQCLQYVNFEARCSWSEQMADTTCVHIYTTRYVGSSGVLNTGRKKPLILFINGSEPRPQLGGKRYYDLFDSKAKSSLKPRARLRL